MRPATVAAGLLVCAAAAMAAAALTAGGDGRGAGPRGASRPRRRSRPRRARDGLAVWAANGCGSCHTFAPANAHAPVGPDLGATLKGMPASYIRESIVDPNAIAAAGYTTGMMPEDYSERIPPAQLERLVRFIRDGVPRLSQRAASRHCTSSRSGPRS